MDMKLNECDRLTPSQDDGIWDRDDWKLNPLILNDVMIKFGIWPNIDCFATDTNRHAFDYYITKQQDFFDKMYDCRKFWSYVVAWSNPPFEDEIVDRTIRTYRKRRMRGYICLPDWKWKEWYKLAKRYCRSFELIKGKGLSQVYFPKSTRNKRGRKKGQWDSIVFYFDFQ